MPKDLNFFIAQVSGALVLNAAHAAASADAALEQLAVKETEIATLKARIVALETAPPPIP